MGTQGLVRAAALLAAFGALAAPPARADSIRCEGGLVQTGDAKIDLLAKCGRPSLVEDATVEKAAFDVRNGVGRRVISGVDVWTYDFGPSRFVQVVRLVRGRVQSVAGGGYGYAEEQPWRGRPAKARCEPSALSVGKLTLEVLARCGEPAVKDEWTEETAAVRTEGEGKGETVYTDVVTRTVALWTYDFGPNRFVRFARVEDGRVTRVDSGSYGYGE